MNDTPMCPLYAQEHLEAMYPDVYNKVYPMVKLCCEMYDVPTNPGFYPYPTRSAVDQMTDYIYQNMGESGASQVKQQFGGELLRSLILILLIRELLRRRRTI